MMQKVLLLALLLFPVPALADTARILPAKAIGVGPTVAASFTELIRVAVTKAGYHVVTNGKKKTDLKLRPTVTKVGSGLLLALEKQDKDGEPFEDSLRIASEDEMDTGVRRLVSAVLRGEPVQDSETVDDITQSEAEAGTLRKRTVRHVLFAFGPSWAYGLGSTDLLYNFQLGYVWERDHLAPKVFLEANWAPGVSNMGSAHAELGLDYFLLAGRQSPYIGFDAGIGGVMRANTEADKRDGNHMSYSGFSLGADIGIAIMRTADVSMFLQGTIRPLIGGIAGKGAGIYGAEVGILF